MVLASNGLNAATQPMPVRIEFYKDALHIQEKSKGYDSIFRFGSGITGKTTLSYGMATLMIEDHWIISDHELKLYRKLRCRGDENAAIMSSVSLIIDRPQPRADMDYFAPGVIYGGTDHLTSTAIGGSEYQERIHIREDRLPAPVFGVHFSDGTSISLLDTKPDGGTTKADAQDTIIQTVIDRDIRLGAIGIDHVKDTVAIGFWYPATEGEVTYLGNTYPGGQKHAWRRRYHPLIDGMTQEYQVSFRVGEKESYSDYYYHAWRWAWQKLRPKVVYQDIARVRQSLIRQLSGEIFNYPQGLGISNWMLATKSNSQRDTRCIMGFTGKALESAEVLLLNAALHPEKGLTDSSFTKAVGLIGNFINRVPIAPAGAEGFDLISGELSYALSFQGINEVFLRSYTDDLKSLLRGYKLEKKQGRDHKNWLSYAKGFAEWLLPQQATNGGFPRAWAFRTAVLRDASPQASYNTIPFLVLLTQLTRDQRYLHAAIRAGIFSMHQQEKGVFAGGTIDNPDIIDKEAGSLSIEAYLALYDMTKDRNWLHAAERAAKFAETWIYLWNVPMPADAKDEELDWKHDVSTTGAQLIATGHSLTDNYMSFDVDEFARLYKLTHNEHYKDVSRLLLHNTKSMIAIPGRMYDLRGIGWSQEHFSFAPPRGIGLHRGWLPWVTTSHLNGILMLEALDKKLFEELCDDHQRSDSGRARYR